MHLYITALMAAALALLLVALAIATIILRMRYGAAFGDAGQQPLTSAIRAHGNLAEYMPIGITLTGLLEASGVNHVLLGGLAAGFVAARLLNAVGLFAPPGPPPPWPRAVGIVATLLILAVMALWLVASVLQTMS
ncbi:MAPEG family protein [Sphingomonas sp. GlSt437]|uniref:MAPEG family protein n=1 Tax=Sphingomonas sp. GlSt437 TaxID=3389970 RepID=UPI003A85B842